MFPSGDQSSEVFNSYYIQSCTGQQLFCKYWPTKGDPRALVFLSHGFTEHCSVYEDLAQALSKSGILSFGHDHVGHGRSEGARTLVGSIDNCVEDVFHHIYIMKKKYPGLPVFIVGNSMGATIGIFASLKKPEEFRGFVAMATSIPRNYGEATRFKTFMQQLFRWLGWLIPSMPLGWIKYDLVIRTEEGKQKVLEDPHMYKGLWVKAGWVKTMLDTAPKLQTELVNLTVPLLIIHGGQDKICNISGAKKFFETSSSKDKTLKSIPTSLKILKSKY
ncbi:monoglyceride lipase-like isoform X2 [Tachypleus tridentatus]|uniref:monoglyceride lipase-like isoform X2 n=1 Tax=Tachypleus tridentatus TaxID=6853 RepID=UPI003FD4CEC4